MSQLQIDLQDEYGLDAALLPELERAALATLSLKGAPKAAALTILLTDDQTLRRLNRDFRGLDSVTDVLSFSDGEPLLPEQGSYLGDVAIAVPQAARQAAAGGHSLAAELQLLIVHGVLHLLGYDHLQAEEKARMWAAQERALTSIGAEIRAPILPDESP